MLFVVKHNVLQYLKELFTLKTTFADNLLTSMLLTFSQKEI